MRTAAPGMGWAAMGLAGNADQRLVDDRRCFFFGETQLLRGPLDPRTGLAAHGTILHARRDHPAIMLAPLTQLVDEAGAEHAGEEGKRADADDRDQAAEHLPDRH